MIQLLRVQTCPTLMRGLLGNLPLDCPAGAPIFFLCGMLITLDKLPVLVMAASIMDLLLRAYGVRHFSCCMSACGELSWERSYQF